MITAFLYLSDINGHIITLALAGAMHMHRARLSDDAAAAFGGILGRRPTRSCGIQSRRLWA
jgi:hypothetical protein